VYPENLKYSQDHEWVKSEPGNKAKVGISYFAQKELGDVVFVELPEIGAKVNVGDSFAVVESVKAVSDVYSPVSGVIVAVNQALADAPELINEDSYEKGWIAVIEMSNAADLDQLMNVAAYKASIGEA
jgi:glycine cleavage system H protein